jgi:hypothetical protein
VVRVHWFNGTSATVRRLVTPVTNVIQQQVGRSTERRCSWQTGASRKWVVTVKCVVPALLPEGHVTPSARTNVANQTAFKPAKRQHNKRKGIGHSTVMDNHRPSSMFSAHVMAEHNSHNDVHHANCSKFTPVIHARFVLY